VISTGVSIATIKYYLREGLLPPGAKVNPRLAEYDASHVRRLRLLRVLRDVGAVPVEDLKSVVDATADRNTAVHQVFGAACDALSGPARSDGVGPASREVADLLVARAGWTDVRPDAPGRDRLAEVLDVVLGLGGQLSAEGAGTYLGLVDAIAAFEIDRVDAEADREAMMEQMVIGQVVFGELLLSLRRLAHEHHSARRFGSAP
jgi:DNA-binding transcriptional MerR regulator